MLLWFYCSCCDACVEGTEHVCWMFCNVPTLTLWLGVGWVRRPPAVFSGVTREMFPVGLFFVLASMGFTLTRQDFVDTWRMPGAPT